MGRAGWNANVCNTRLNICNDNRISKSQGISSTVTKSPWSTTRKSTRNWLHKEWENKWFFHSKNHKAQYWEFNTDTSSTKSVLLWLRIICRLKPLLVGLTLGSRVLSAFSSDIHLQIKLVWCCLNVLLLTLKKNNTWNCFLISHTYVLSYIHVCDLFAGSNHRNCFIFLFYQCSDSTTEQMRIKKENKFIKKWK